MTYVAKGGSSATTSEIILNTKCAIGSTKIEAPTIETPQFVERGTVGAGFEFDKFINTHKFCKDLDYKITDKNKNQYVGFEKTVSYASKLKFLLSNVKEVKTYNDIYILNTARGGDELLSGPYSLTVDCKKESDCEVPVV